jgi:hypothetical protein
LRVGLVTGSPGAYKVRTHADLGALDAVSVLFFDTPELVRTDPPAVPLDRALSASPADPKVPDTVPTASAEQPNVTGAIKQAETSAAAPAASVAQTQQ